jgi:hypothetical protein
VDFMKSILYLLEQYYAFTKVEEVLHNIELFYGQAEWEYEDTEFIMSEIEFECWLKVGVIWVKNIHKYETRKRKASKMTGSSGVALVGLDVGSSANDGSRDQKHRNLWLADSGASCHMTFDGTGMFDCRDIRSQIKIGNSQTMTAIKLVRKGFMW